MDSKSCSVRCPASLRVSRLHACSLALGARAVYLEAFVVKHMVLVPKLAMPIVQLLPPPYNRPQNVISSFTKVLCMFDSHGVWACSLWKGP